MNGRRPSLAGLRDQLRRRWSVAIADVSFAAWRTLGRVGANGPASRHAKRFASVGDGTAFAFPPGATLGEASIHIGSDTLIGPNVALSAGLWAGDPIEPEQEWAVRIGDRCNIGRGSSIAARVGIEIGDEVTLAPNVFITDHNHDYGNPGMAIKRQWIVSEPVSIGPGCWLGVGVVVLPGTRLGRNVAVAAGSVVRGEIEDRCVIAGAPARVIRRWDSGNACWDPPQARALDTAEIPPGWFDGVEETW